ncbi:MAG: hypothetical protein JNL79_08185 [Myxococcales bacterium]|nr:hypothetical protein [Myxococcales bacterium]
MNAAARFLQAGLLVSSALAVTSPASAQEWVPVGRLELSDGIERGAFGTRTSRVTLRAGLDLAVDERPSEIFGGSLLFEVAPHSAVGLDLRYGRRLGHFVVEGLVVGFVFPETMFGVGTALTYRIPLGSSVSIAVGPELRAFFLGSDLPTKTPLLQGLLRGGIHVAF